MCVCVCGSLHICVIANIRVMCFGGGGREKN